MNNPTHLLGAALAIATALVDTAEDETLPGHLRKAQLKNLLEHLEQLKEELKS